MCLDICDPLLDVCIVQETLLKVMLQPGIGLFPLGIRQCSVVFGNAGLFTCLLGNLQCKAVSSTVWTAAGISE